MSRDVLTDSGSAALDVGVLLARVGILVYLGWALSHHVGAVDGAAITLAFWWFCLALQRGGR